MRPRRTDVGGGGSDSTRHGEKRTISGNKGRASKTPEEFGPFFLEKQTRMLSIHRAILVAAGLWCFGSTAILPHLVQHALAKELGIRDDHDRSDPLSVTQREAGSGLARGAPYSSATTPTVGSPEYLRDAAETARRDKELARQLNGICRGC